MVLEKGRIVASGSHDEIIQFHADWKKYFYENERKSLIKEESKGSFENLKELEDLELI